MSVNYEVVYTKDWILSKIYSGDFNSHKPIPSQYEISRQLDISRDAIELAFHELITEQIITEHFQEGYFVKEKPPFNYPVDELKSITSMIEEAGYVAGTLIISQDIEQPSLDDKNVLNIEDDRKITVIERIRTANETPVVYCLDKVNMSNVEMDGSINSRSLFDALMDAGLAINYATTEIESIGYEPYISNALDCAPEDSLLLFKQIHYNKNDEPVLYSMNYFKSSQVKFKIRRTKKD
ncbi:GntR family transcriptional regulator [Macrococcoides canis]|uniref:GntR family transcriptional regulator n=1 Tax=Macrococcoides canis TaxID=1855823 RepID=UPI001AEBE185|nr:GntR family transcriptional regulator [Macrococcus canis]QTQ09171.1 GntR family transcriptional regulator [Macrococcus canis]